MVTSRLRHLIQRGGVSRRYCPRLFLNADRLRGRIPLDPYDAARVANEIRAQLAAQRESFIFETVLSDPVGEKIGFLKAQAASGYCVVVCFIGIGSSEISAERVAMRVSQGGHDVPLDKLTSRFPRTLANLKLAIRELPAVLVFDNSDLRTPYRLVAEFSSGTVLFLQEPVPAWLESAM